MSTPPANRFRILLAFALVYVFWGSTYLGISIAVSRIPPIMMAGIRFSIAGAVMLAFCALRGQRVRPTLDQLWRLALVGILLLAISNAVLGWAEIYVPTGLAALLVSITPIWFLFIDHVLLGPVSTKIASGGRRKAGSANGRLTPPASSVGDAGARSLEPGAGQKRASAEARSPEPGDIVSGPNRVGRPALVGVALGIAGMIVLLWPRLLETRALGGWELFAALSLLGSSFTWAFGSVLAHRWHVRLDPLVGGGWQMLAGGVVDLAVALALGEHRTATWDWKGLGAILYLVVFGSWVGYSAYVYLLHHLPTAKVSTYAYVNPVVAVILGWLILGEPIDRFMVAGAAIIVPAVALVTTAEHDIEPAD